MRKIIHLTPFAAILSVALFLCWKFLFQGYLFGYDSYIHTLWAQQFLKGLHSGVIYPRWLPDVNCGAGSPTFVFYPPFIFYTYAAIELFIKEIPEVLNASAFLAVLASGLSMYVYSRLFLGRAASSAAAAVYMALPYHMLTLYERVAMADLWAFFWLPLILYCAHRLKRGNIASFTGLSFVYACLIMSHLPTTLIFSPFLIAYVVFLFSRDRDIKTFLQRLLAPGVGILLSYIYLLPALAEQKYVNIAAITGDIGEQFDFRINFLFSQLAKIQESNWRISLMAAAAATVIIYFLVFSLLPGRKGSLSTARFFAFSGLASLFMQTGASQPLWEALTVFQFHKLQFPWRLLTVTTVFTALCAGFSLEQLSGMKKPLLKVPLTVAFIAVLAFNGILSNLVIAEFLISRSLKEEVSIRADMYEDELSENYAGYVVLPWSKDSRKFKQYLIKGAKLVDVEEYRPKNADFSGKSFRIMCTSNSQAALTGEGEVQVLSLKRGERLLKVRARETGIVIVKTFYYPGWHAYENGNPVELTCEPASGLMCFSIAPGTHDIVLKYEGTPWQKAGAFVSALTVLFLAGLCLRERIRPPGQNDKTRKK